MNTKHKSRNLNLMILSGMLRRIVEDHAADGWVEKKELLPFLGELVGKDGLDEIESRIFDCTENGFCIFDQEKNGRYHLASSGVPLLSPTWDESRLLLDLLKQGCGRFFLDEETERLLLSRLEEHLGEEPRLDRTATVWKGASNLADDLTDPGLRQNYRLVSEVIRKEKGLRFSYRFDGEWQESACFPCTFSFSPLEARWRVLGVGEKGEAAVFYLANMKDLRQENWNGEKEFPAAPMETVVFLIREGRNSLDRVSARFADCEKEIAENSDLNYPYRMAVSYPASQRHLVAGRLLSLGTGVFVVTESLREELLRTVKSAFRGYQVIPADV